MNAYDEYMKQVVKPMRSELTDAGFKELITTEDVQDHMAKAGGISLIVINSVCGCAAGLARPAVVAAVNELEVKPDNLVTVFAGQDQEATATMRSYFEEIPPSSPSIAIWKDDQLAYFIPREQIESNSMETIKEHLSGVLSQIVSS
ncbi:BrxA/BrxB family bacilliredoxin [Psychrobacillus glaciei]|uniref:BrxA/BrxB family bacilliredoxin n=1 Tax=Psychrobacillus glaciei TaxID=2283160 RepID=A0A5J6SLY3_9BACI|nr:BrxA/BrxB family bacilliredoxin [Psychrobacillus glaciei]QFF98898.1 BrxA/BrxB family bacilliredoxin [Psychrobacillus glaciei]